MGTREDTVSWALSLFSLGPQPPASVLRPPSSGHCSAGLSRFPEKEAKRSSRNSSCRWRGAYEGETEGVAASQPLPHPLCPSLDPRQGVNAVPYPEL